MELEHNFTVPAPVDVVWEALLDPERVAPCMPGATLKSVEGKNFTGTVKVKLGPVSLLYKGTGEFTRTDADSRTVVIDASGKDSRGNGTAGATVTVQLSESGQGTAGAVHTDLNITGRPAQFGRGMMADVGGKILDSFAECLAGKLGQDGDSAQSDAGQSGAGQSGTGQSSGAGQSSGTDTSSAKPAASTAAATETATSKPAEPSPQPSSSQSASSSQQASQSASQPSATPSTPSSGAKPSATPSENVEPLDLMEYAGSSLMQRAVPVAVAAGVLALGAVLFAVLRRRRRR